MKLLLVVLLAEGKACGAQVMTAMTVLSLVSMVVPQAASVVSNVSHYCDSVVLMEKEEKIAFNASPVGNVFATRQIHLMEVCLV